MEQIGGGFLESLPPDLRKRVQGLLRVQRTKRGQTLLARGDPSTDVYFILEGSFHVVVYSASGREVSLRNLSAGDVFGELAAVDGLPRSASVVADTEARVAALRREDFREVLMRSPATAFWLAKLLTGKIRDINERLFELSALNVPARLHCELLRLARTTPDPNAPMVIDPAPTHAELANRIGSHREAVTREIRALVERNILRAGRRTLEILDIARLEYFVGQAVGGLLAQR